MSLPVTVVAVTVELLVTLTVPPADVSPAPSVMLLPAPAANVKLIESPVITGVFATMVITADPPLPLHPTALGGITYGPVRNAVVPVNPLAGEHAPVTPVSAIVHVTPSAATDEPVAFGAMVGAPQQDDATNNETSSTRIIESLASSVSPRRGL